MFRSVRGRLILSYVLFTLFTIALLGFLGLSLVRRSLDGQEIDFLTLNAEGIALEAAPLLWPVPRPSELQEIADSAAFLIDTRVRILDEEGEVIADSGRPKEFDQFVFIFPSGELPFDPPNDEAGTLVIRLSGGEIGLARDLAEFPLTAGEMLANFPPDTRYTFIERVSNPWGQRVFFAARRPVERSLSPARSARTFHVPILQGGRTLGFVELSQGPNFAQNALATFRQAFLIAAGGAVLLAGLLGLIAARWLTRPLQGLADAARRMGEGDLGARAPADQATEIGEVAAQFNEMANRLEASFNELSQERDTLRRFIADASHELRTPITALTNFLELLRGPAYQEPATRQEFLQESQAQVNRLAWVTDNLLDLSRLDAGLAALDLGSCHLPELLAEVITAQSPIAAEKGIDLVISDTVADIWVWCDRARMVLAIGNLVENAIKFSRAGDRVVLGGGREGDQAAIWVKDFGPGIDHAEQALIFDRFYRGKGHQEKGSGLGLAIVKSVVEAHGGQVDLDSEPGQGARFMLLLPSTDPQ